MTTKLRTRFTQPKTYRNIARDKIKGRRGGPAAGSRKKHPKKVTDYGIQLREKQKVKFNYGLREKQFNAVVAKASKVKGDSTARLYELLESRLDSVVFRSGLIDKRPVARQTVSHGHIMVNGRRVNIPSYAVKIGDKIAIRPQSADKGIFKDLEIKLKKYNVPAWINLDKSQKVAEIIGPPNVDSEGLRGALEVILEFYSR